MTTDRDKQKQEFSERLNQAANESGQKQRGLYAAIARDFTRQGRKVSEQAVRLWFKGMGMPDDVNMRRLARRFNVRSEWLRYGPSAGAMREVDAVLADGSQTRLELHKVPVLRPGQYLQWRDSPIEEGAEGHVHVTGDLSPGAFAFTLTDNSALPFGARGMKAVVEPEHPEMSDPVSAKKLIVVFDNGVFLAGRYSVRDTALIEPTNTDFKPVPLSQDHIVAGVLVKLAQQDV